MKNALILTALFAFPCAALSGCGGAEPKVIEPAADEDTNLTSQQQKQIEESMRSGAGFSSKKSQPKN